MCMLLRYMSLALGSDMELSFQHAHTDIQYVQGYYLTPNTPTASRKGKPYVRFLQALVDQ